MKPLRLLLLSTPVAPLGSGLGGGVELTIANLARILVQLGHEVTIVTPAGAQVEPLGLSTLPVDIIQVPGALQPTAQTSGRSASVVVSAALSNAWAYAQRAQSQYDLLVNFAYDWLPFFLTAFVTVPVAHFVSMGSLSDRLDQAIAQVSTQFPGTLGAYTQAQADTFRATDLPIAWQILGCGLDLSQYECRLHTGDHLAWAGRISPEKGLEDAIAAAKSARKPLKIYGAIEDENYWQSLQPRLMTCSEPIEYCGFLPTRLLQRALGSAQALLVTPRWLEAFGIVAIEALACGVPVVAYRHGGPAEIVEDGKTGWLVTPGDVSELAAAIARLDRLDRTECRLQAETFYSLAAWGKRCEQWFYQIVAG